MKTISNKAVWLSALVLAATMAPARAQSFDWYEISGGGGTSTDGTYTLTGTIHPWDAAPTLVGGDFALQTGFWPGILAMTVPGPAPTLFIQTAADDLITISWSPDTPGFVLEQSGDLSTGAWTPLLTGNPAVLTIDSSARFYRLRRGTGL